MLRYRIDGVHPHRFDQIKRSVQLELKDGQNEVEVKNLSSSIDQDSIRVDGFGNAIILDVIYRTSFPFHSFRDDPQ